MDIFAFDKVFVTINFSTVHWYYATIDMKKKTIEMHNSSEDGYDQATVDMTHLWWYLQDEHARIQKRHARKHNRDPQPVLGKWKFIRVQLLNNPQQNNSKFYVFLTN